MGHRLGNTCPEAKNPLIHYKKLVPCRGKFFSANLTGRKFLHFFNFWLFIFKSRIKDEVRQASSNSVSLMQMVLWPVKVMLQLLFCLLCAASNNVAYRCQSMSVATLPEWFHLLAKLRHFKIMYLCCCGTYRWIIAIRNSSVKS